MAPGALQDLEYFGETFAALAVGYAVRLVRTRNAATANAEDESSLADMVERRNFLGQPQRMAQWQHLDANADLYATRAHGYGAGENERRRGDRPLRREVQFGEPNRVEAPAFGGVGLGKGLS